MLSYALLQYLCTRCENPPCGVKAKLRHASNVYGPNHVSLFFWLASIGSFTQMVNDREEMRFCAVGTEIFAEAARKRDGATSDDAQFFDIIGYRYSNRLVELGGADPEANQRLKAQLTGPLAGFFADETATETFSPEVQRFSKCLNLAFGAMENEAIVETARNLDANEVAKLQPSLEAADGDIVKLGFNPIELLALASIGEARKFELRCAVFAQAYVNDPNAVPQLAPAGLTTGKVAALRDQLSKLIITESGVSQAGIDGLFAMIVKDVGAIPDEETKVCTPLFRSIVTSPEGLTTIALSPAVPPDQPTLPRCYAILTRNADGLIGEAGADAERESDYRLAERLADAFLMQNAADPERAGAEISLAMAHLNDNAHKGIVDPDLQTRLNACRTIASALPDVEAVSN